MICPLDKTHCGGVCGGWVWVFGDGKRVWWWEEEASHRKRMKSEGRGRRFIRSVHWCWLADVASVWTLRNWAVRSVRSVHSSLIGWFSSGMDSAKFQRICQVELDGRFWLVGWGLTEFSMLFQGCGGSCQNDCRGLRDDCATFFNKIKTSVFMECVWSGGNNFGCNGWELKALLTAKVWAGRPVWENARKMMDWGPSKFIFK
jgi:hypothetical protein